VPHPQIGECAPSLGGDTRADEEPSKLAESVASELLPLDLVHILLQMWLRKGGAGSWNARRSLEERNGAGGTLNGRTDGYRGSTRVAAG
jgi:hypothetical protein